MPADRAVDAAPQAREGLLSQPGFWASIAVALLLGIVTGVILTVLAPDLPKVIGFALQAAVMVLSLPLGSWTPSRELIGYRRSAPPGHHSCREAMWLKALIPSR